ncbi:helix-turn-helix domain-containing protein [Kribbella sp. NPDC050124]|uniref:helix-turn-helix domain-containing protein n=1 Tax=Kribbella sp. NPDC050124 TaxID=3364114 RepID=UPI0037ABB7D1
MSAVEIHTTRDLGAAVRHARAKRGLTQSQLAQQAGVSRDWLVRLEHGHPRLELRLVLDTVAAVGLTLLTEDRDAELQDETEVAWNEVFGSLGGNQPADGKSSEDG